MNRADWMSDEGYASALRAEGFAGQLMRKSRTATLRHFVVGLTAIAVLLLLAHTLGGFVDPYLEVLDIPSSTNAFYRTITGASAAVALAIAVGIAAGVCSLLALVAIGFGELLERCYKSWRSMRTSRQNRSGSVGKDGAVNGIET
ncbi:hypothetical protein [Piscinibacter gummiphilus]|uniref:Uncharacterized protein n=1 Tax=Piscinibacter gummiphilus TaxID=946333 RepID=A0ABZ0D348_9BURK|nr:hypothetical protein [Piscinibacter gummiphilus]WOB11226.1 hypothetical protein RXV79_26710 [Piscinibacter gummiphilus]